MVFAMALSDCAGRFTASHLRLLEGVIVSGEPNGGGVIV